MINSAVEFCYRLSLFRKVLDAEMREGTREGLSTKCKKPERREITAEEEEMMWAKGVLGTETAECLLHTIYFYNGKMFGLRAAEHRQLRFHNIRVENNHVVFDESYSKTFHGGLNDLKYQPRVVKHFCHKPGVEHDRCLVYIYKMYLRKNQKLAENIEAFYFRPHRNSKVFDYEGVAIGINTLNKILPEKLCARAGLTRKTAHSLRVTCATNLFQSGAEEKVIRERTGHKSNALPRYEHPTEKQLEKASTALGPVKSYEFELSTDIEVNESIFWNELEVTDEILSQIEIPELGDEYVSSLFDDDNSDDLLCEIAMAEENKESKDHSNTDNNSNVMVNPIFNSCTVNLTVNMCPKQ